MLVNVGALAFAPYAVRSVLVTPYEDHTDVSVSYYSGEPDLVCFDDSTEAETFANQVVNAVNAYHAAKAHCCPPGRIEQTNQGWVYNPGPACGPV